MYVVTGWDGTGYISFSLSFAGAAIVALHTQAQADTHILGYCLKHF